MHKFKTNSLILFVVLGFSLLLQLKGYSQSNSPYTPTIVPKSPDAAALAKFGDIPVSPYTGTSDISVPIFTIDARGVKVPISLDYHTGGIRLSEEASSVGLGWALNAGGMISRTINDKDDFEGKYFNSDLVVPVPEIKGKLLTRTLYQNEPPAGPWGYFFTCRWNVLSELGTYYNYNSWQNILASPSTYDMEADSYSFNFPGHSGKFIIGRDRKIILQKQENLAIQCASDGSYFIITDDQGNKFYFNDLEYSQPATGGATHISSWQLSKIVTQLKDSVLFSYTYDGSMTLIKGANQESNRSGVPGAEGTTYSNDPGQYYYNKVLQSIDYTNAEIQFTFDSRTDEQGGKKLNNIKIYAKDDNGLKYLKEDQLYYSYFNPLISGGDSYEALRLRLDSVKEISGTSAMPPYKFSYNFPTQNQGLMGKHFSSVDHWGFFNGAANAVNGNNSLGFIPPFLGLVNIGDVPATTLVDLPGANREPDATNMAAFSLSKVTYPTGGYTVLELEPNYYDHYKSIAGTGGRDFPHSATVSKTAQYIINVNGTTSGTVDLSKIFYTVGIDPFTGLPYGTNGTISIAFRAASSDSLNYYHNGLGYGKINFTFANNITDISDASLYCNGTLTNGICSGTVYSAALDMSITSKGIYNWSAYIDPKVKMGGGLQDIVVTFTWKEAVFDNQTMMMAGGLRVKSITDYDANDKMVKKRRYDYSYTEDRNGDGAMETYSYGRLMGYLSYERYELIDFSSSHHGVSLTRYGSSQTSTTSMSSGNIVGYDQVTEYSVDPETGEDNGKTVYKFNNSSDTTWSYGGYRFPGVQDLPNNLNGMALSTTVYSRSGLAYKKISTTDYYYRTANRVIYDGLKYQYLSNMTTSSPGVLQCQPGTGEEACYCPLNIDSVVVWLQADYYPALSSEKILLDSTVETTYDQNDTNLVISNVNRNYYDNPKHYQLTRSNVTDSKGNNLTSLIKYPQDYIPNGWSVTNNTILDSMINKNMVSVPVEKRDSLYYAGSSTGYITGAQLSTYILLPSNSIALDKQYNLQIQSPVTDFQGFAINGNSTSKDSRYRQMISFDSYDNSNNILQYTTTDQLPISIIWDYKNIYPVAQVQKASVSDIAYTSFEASGKGNWSYTGISTADATSPSGNNCYNLNQGGASITKSGLASGTSYIVSYWIKVSTALTISGTQTGYPVKGKTIDGWTFFEHKISGVSSIIVSGTNYIDELRLYPANALMTTYTYAPLVGMTSACDPGNRITYYNYDEFLRLKWIKDQDKNIIKTFHYHYIKQGAPNN